MFSYVNLVGEKTRQVLSLAPLAVQPNYQKRGIGSKLVRMGLAIAESREEPLVLVLEHSWFYPRFGFQPANSYGIEHPVTVPEEAFMVKPLKNYQENYRGKVIYPPSFIDSDISPE